MSIVFLLIVGVSRKKHLLLVSGFGMAVVLSLMNVAYYNDILNNDEPWLLSLFFIYIIFYSIGYGPIPWILMPEICPRNVSSQFQYEYLFIFYNNSSTVYVINCLVSEIIMYK